MAGQASGPPAAAHSARLLRFAPEARLLIINSDDFGMYPAINTAVLRSIVEGIASSCSLMVPCPAARHAMHLLGQHPQIPFGIHLTLLCDTAHYRWGPLTAKQKLPSLLDQTGELFTPAEIPRLLARARLDEVEREFRAQIDAVASAGLTPTHLDWHCLADGGRRDIFDLTLALAHEHGPAMRAWLGPGRQELRRQGLPAVDHDFLDSFRLDTATKPAQYAALLHDLPPGLTEWAVHPGLASEQAQAIDPDGWRVRWTDYQFLTSPQAKELLQQQGIIVIDYRTIQLAWSQTR
jgi:chitin disaccharide deacetylase